MTTPSPSEFLTFMRHVSVRSSIRPQLITARTSIAANCKYAATATQRRHASTVKTDQYEPHKKEHTVDRAHKGETGNIQEDAAAKGMSSRAKAEGGKDNATGQKDLAGATAKAKKDHPEAPDTIIGMQDERGQRGH